MLKSLSPFLQVTDLDLAKSFYGNIGFRLRWLYPDETPTHMAMSSQGVDLSFVLVDEVNSKVDLYIQVDGVKEYYEAFLEKLDEVSPLVKSAYGMLDFSLEDPWGHHLVFGEDLGQNKAGQFLMPSVSDAPFVFVTTKEKTSLSNQAILLFKEEKGTTMILPQQEAVKQGYNYDEIWAHISLGLESDLGMVGLTAKFSTALALENIPCNVVAAYYHDHIFVPYEMKNHATRILTSLKM